MHVGVLPGTVSYLQRPLTSHQDAQAGRSTETLLACANNHINAPVVHADLLTGHGANTVQDHLEHGERNAESAVSQLRTRDSGDRRLTVSPIILASAKTAVEVSTCVNATALYFLPLRACSSSGWVAALPKSALISSTSAPYARRLELQISRQSCQWQYGLFDSPVSETVTKITRIQQQDGLPRLNQISTNLSSSESKVISAFLGDLGI